MQDLSLRPKYSLDQAAVEGAQSTIPAETFTYLTGRRYPYPRIGTRASDGMFPEQRVGDMYAPGLYTSRVALGSGIRDVRPKLRIEERNPNLGSNVMLKPHYTLNETVVQGVMPASTYERLTGKITTEPGLPRVVIDGETLEQYSQSLMLEAPQQRLVSAPVKAPTLEWDWGTFFWGSVAGGVTAILLAYGVIPALAEAGAQIVKKRLV